jgi:hypothetical protein
MCVALQSSNAKEREKAEEALARLQQLSEYPLPPAAIASQSSSSELTPEDAEEERRQQAETAGQAAAALERELLQLSTKALRQRAVVANVRAAKLSTQQPSFTLVPSLSWQLISLSLLCYIVCARRSTSMPSKTRESPQTLRQS